MSRLLDKIDNPQDLKKLTARELKQLAVEIREELITTVINNGGHLASNLGVVELTLALHRVFDSPRDKIIWDVGHQSYIHKLLTGRKENFATLRQYGGLSGFTSRAESEHDPFGAGHARIGVSHRRSPTRVHQWESARVPSLKLPQFHAGAGSQ